MTVELWAVLIGLATLAVATTVQLFAGISDNDFMKQLGPRDDSTYGAFHGRCTRALQNQIESLVLFVPIAIIVVMVGVNNDLSALGAKIYVISRIIYFPLYWFGIPGLRTAAFTGGLVGTLMTVWPVFGQM